MALQNSWVGYLQRGYSDIKISLITGLRKRVPEMTDHSESNLMILLISMFGGITEQLNYYIDNMARESFLLSARRYSSVIRLVKLLDYRIKARIASAVDLTITFDTPLTAPYTIPIGSIFTSDNGIPFITTSATDALIGATNIVVPTLQKKALDAYSLGITDGVGGQIIGLPGDYLDGSISLKIGTDTAWEYKETLGLSGPTDKHYTVFLDVSGLLFVLFGDNFNGAIPVGASPILFYGFLTEGSAGNIQAGSITTAQSTLTPPSPTTISTITNSFASAGGQFIESIDSIRVKAPLSIRTLDRAVTKQDYIDISKMAPGVSKSNLLFECGKSVEIFISPEGGGIAQTALLSTTKNFIDQRKMVTTFVDVRPAGESIIKIKMTVTAKFRESAILTENDVRNSLLSAYSYLNSNVNKNIRQSDIYSIVDTLPRVDFLILDELTLLPYARPKGHTLQMIWERQINIGSVLTTNWKLEFNGTTFNVFKEGVYIGNALLSVPYTDPSDIITFTINPTAYIVGQSWEFITEPYNKDVSTNDYSLPITNTAFLEITVLEQLVTNN
jgi:hypothetical protein